MKNYFDNFPEATYTLPSGTKFTTKDLSIRFVPISSIVGKYLTKYAYQLNDIDRPDIIAHQYYGHADFVWLVLISGGLAHYLNDFPLDNESLDKYIEDKYGITVEQAMSTIRHYVDDDGDIVDSGTALSIYDYEFNKNESTRIIKLISRQYLPEIVSEMDEFFRKIKKAR